MDFLGLRNLSIIRNCIKIINARKEKNDAVLPTADELRFEEFFATMHLELPLDDKPTYDNVFKIGDTTGIFQFESGGMRKFLV